MTFGVYMSLKNEKHLGGGLIFHNFPLNNFIMLGSSYFKHLYLHHHFLTIVVDVVLQLLSKGTQRLLKLISNKLVLFKRFVYFNMIFFLLNIQILYFFIFYLFLQIYIIIKALKLVTFLIKYILECKPFKILSH